MQVHQQQDPTAHPPADQPKIPTRQLGTEPIRPEVLAKINEALGQDLKLGKARQVDIVDAQGNLIRGGGVFIPTYTSAEGDAGGGYILSNTSNRIYHITGTGKDNSYIPAHSVDLGTGVLSKTIGGMPKLHLRGISDAIAILDLKDRDGDGVYSRRGFNGDYYLQRELDGTISVFFNGKTHAGVRDSSGRLTQLFKPQTLKYGGWDLKAAAQQTAQLERQRTKNLEVSRSVATALSTSRAGDKHTTVAGSDTVASGSGMYFVDGSVSRHAEEPSKEAWHEHSRIQHPQIGNLEIPIGNDVQSVRERRAVAVPTYQTTEDASGVSRTSYTFIRNYDTRQGVLHLVDVPDGAVISDTIREVYETAQDETENTLITDVWLKISGNRRAQVRSDGSVLLENTASGGKELVVLVPGLKESSTSTAIAWESRTMRPGRKGEVEYVETRESVLARRRQLLEREKSRSSESKLREWKYANARAAERKATALFEAHAQSGIYAVSDIEVAEDIKTRNATSTALAVTHEGETAYVFTRWYKDARSKHRNAGVAFYKKSDFTATLAQGTELRWLIEQAYGNIEKSGSIEQWITVSDAKHGSAQLQLRSDGSVLHRSSERDAEARIIRPMHEKGKLHSWDTVPVYRHADGRYYSQRDS